MFLCCNKFYEVELADAKKNLEQFEYESEFVPKSAHGVPFLKIKDDTIKEYIKEDRIIITIYS
jgi:hypothetical protein